MSSSGDDAISPELVLVSPELRARAIEALPRIEPDSYFLPRFVEREPLPAAGPVRTLRLVVGDFTRVGAFAVAATVLIVLTLTLVADLIR